MTTGNQPTDAGLMCKKCAWTQYSVLTQRKRLDSKSLKPPPKALRFSLEISLKLPAEIKKCLEDSKQWLQVCYHSQCLCKLWYARNGKICLAGCGEERILQLRVVP